MGLIGVRGSLLTLDFKEPYILVGRKLVFGGGYRGVGRNFMISRLYIARTSQIPRNENGENFDVIFCAEKHKKLTEIENNKNLNFIFIVLQKTKLTDIQESISIVEKEWLSFSDMPIEIEHVTDDLNRISKDFKRQFSSTEGVVFKCQTVGFDKSSGIESISARKLLLKVSTKEKWQIWK